MPKTNLNNRGLLQEKIVNPQHFLFGSVGNAFENLIEEPDWTPWIVQKEVQRNQYFDTMSCVSFALANCVEILHKKLAGFEVNYSDRFLAVASGTRPTGNYMSTVAETARTVGLVLEQSYPFPVEAKSWGEYHATPLPAELFDEAAQWKKQWELKWDWVGGSLPILEKAILTSPISVTVQPYWQMNDKGFYVNTGTDYNHNISLVKIASDHFLCFDHYDTEFRKFDLSYQFGAAIRYSLKPLGDMPEEKNPLHLPENAWVNVVDHEGGRQFPVLHIDGTLRFDEYQKLDNQWKSRNAKDGVLLNPPVKTISYADMKRYPVLNLKGAPVSI